MKSYRAIFLKSYEIFLEKVIFLKIGSDLIFIQISNSIKNYKNDRFFRNNKLN
ncbi:conserved hypothetical protein [Candidatus Riesia pediculicola USDA]|uniref:Uncharacterized protein n=1 Tax=Riesia pediculicola (strain USDA) TaxID=515618 RepID=D4G889_RIEPU|nr:conserved hypothetical protein [Candidatus Riesia pediculicola USDA]